MIDNLLQEIRYGARGLCKRPLFTVVALVTLALGIGFNTAIFSVVNAVLLAPLPYGNVNELVTIWKTSLATKTDQLPESVPNLIDLKEQNRVFEQIAALRTQQMILTDGDQPERTGGARVSANLFSLLKVQPLIGRDFLSGEDQPGAGPVVMIGHSLWQQRYGADQGVIGRQLTVDGKSCTIVGVLPPGIYFPNPETKVYVPLVFQPKEILRGQAFLRLIGRLKPGITLAAARADMDALGVRLAQQYPIENTGAGYYVLPLHDQVVGPVRPALIMLLAAVGCVLLIACANVANLLLARAAGRRTEFAIRAALGATRLQLVRQMIIESVLLSLVGGTLGLLVALVGVPALVGISANSIPRAAEIGINLRVLGFTAVVSLVTGVLFGLIPALRSSKQTTNALREGRRGMTASVVHQRLLSLMVISEVAIALVLLVAAGLMLRSFFSLNRVAPGFNPKGVLTIGIGLPTESYPDIPKQAAFYDRLLTEIRTVPGVETAAGAIRVPMVGFNASTGFTIQSRPVPPENAPTVDYRAISQDYFRSMGIPVFEGRDFTDREMKAAPDVVIINKTMAARFFPDGHPLGERIQVYPEPNRWREIIGVVGDVKLASLDADTNPAMYVPMVQNPYPNALRNISLVVRTNGDPKSLVPGIRGTLRSLDKNIPISQVQTMEEIVSNSLAQRRLSMSLLVLFAVLAALLAAVGIYGVMAYLVTQRTHEIGIRLAMGARAVDVLQMVLRDGAKLAAIGVGVGLLSAFALTRVMASLLFGVSAVDPLTFAGISLLLTIVALLASYLPARRASKVDPMVALRNS
ncbi:MAG: macrolide transporter ATP-binding/permease protein [Acidobacteria bacterium]|nr:macrolide transporter ATP-binding/permease protein [Acidobacteriota bacterium]